MGENTQDNKQVRKEGVEYVLCQHLEQETQDWECWAQWIGETKRIILCPVCYQQNLGSFIRNSETAMHLYKQIEYKNWIKEG